MDVSKDIYMDICIDKWMNTCVWSDRTLKSLPKAFVPQSFARARLRAALSSTSRTAAAYMCAVSGRACGYLCVCVCTRACVVYTGERCLKLERGRLILFTRHQHACKQMCDAVRQTEGSPVVALPHYLALLERVRLLDLHQTAVCAATAAPNRPSCARTRARTNLCRGACMRTEGRIFGWMNRRVGE